MKARKIHGRAKCGVELKDRKGSMDLMYILSLNETIDQLAMTNSVHWYGYVLTEHIGRLARMSVLDTEVDGSNPGSSMLFP